MDKLKLQRFARTVEWLRKSLKATLGKDRNYADHRLSDNQHSFMIDIGDKYHIEIVVNLTKGE